MESPDKQHSDFSIYELHFSEQRILTEGPQLSLGKMHHFMHRLANSEIVSGDRDKNSDVLYGTVQHVEETGG